jgi:hypothetical protein
MELFKILTDEHIETIHWLNKCSRGTWSFNKETGLIDVRGSFDCSRGKLKDFKGVKFGVIEEDFDCSDNNLESLEGAPKVVEGYFCCRNNKLKSLVGAPQVVKADFFCNNNKLINLVGAPQEVEGSFNCRNNTISEKTLLLIYETMCTHKCDYHKALTLIKDKIDMKDKIELGFYKGHERATSIICRYI